MNAKAATAILLLAIFAFSTLATVQIRPVKALGGHVYSLPDAEMMLSEFTKEWGPGTLSGKTDVSEPGVQFTFTGLTSSDTGVGDNHPVNQAAGGALYSGHYSDFRAFTRYSMNFTNVGSDAVEVCLFMNTGFTSVDSKKDTYWASETVALGVGEKKIVTLDFSSCYKIWNAEDDPVLEWRHLNGSGGWPVRRLEEVTNLGFQVYKGGGGGGGSIVVSQLTAPLLYADPAHILKGPGDVDSFFDVYVTLENFANLAGFDIKLTWNSDLLTWNATDYDATLTALWGAGKYFIANSTHGAGYCSLAAAALNVVASNTGSSDLFKIRFQVEEGCNFQLSTPIHFDVVKLSDNAEPIPNPIIATVTDGMYYMSGEMPGLMFALTEPDGHPWEECKYFQIEIHVLDIHDCSPVQDYDLTLTYDSELVAFVEVDTWGVLGDTSDQAHVDSTVPGTIHIWDTGGLTWNGTDGVLFTLTFHVEYDARPEHIWKYGVYEHDTFEISMTIGTLSFGSLGTLDPALPSAVSRQVNFIRGDMDADGDVELNDLQSLGWNYGLTGTSIYDLTNDKIVDIYDVVALATNYDYGVPPP